MVKVSNILLEGIAVFSIEVIIKTATEVNKVDIYNQIRALEGVVVVTIEQSEYLDSRTDGKSEWSLLHMKFLTTSSPSKDIHKIRKDAMEVTNVPGLLQFLPRFKTVQKVKVF